MIEVHSGRFVDPLDLQPEDVVIEDVAWALSHQCRYSGHTEWFYSVAQHCVLVSRLVTGDEQLQFDALMHDASETYLQDVPRPIKKDSYVGKAYRGAEARVQRVVSEVFGLTYPEPDEVKEMDIRILLSERSQLLPRAHVGRWSPEIEAAEPVDVVIEHWTPRRSRGEFMSRYEYLDARRDR